MTRMRKRLLEDFIIPALDDERYGSKLCWINKEIGTFRLFWSHKNAAKWKREDTIVFQDWDRLKGHYKPDGTHYFMCAKQRFRAALYKLSPYVRSLKTGDKYHREYQLIFDGNKRRSENLVRPKKNVPKRIHQSSIPTSVIRKNTSYIAKPGLKDQKPMPSSPVFSPNEIQILQQYSSSMEKFNQLRISRHPENGGPDEISQKNFRNVFQKASVLRENSSTPRNPHIASQPVPIYCSHKQFYTNNPNPRVSPPVFVSKIYHEPENVPQIKDDTCSSYSTDDEKSSGILNLSVKSDASSNVPSR